MFAGGALQKTMRATLPGSSSLGHFPQYLGIPLGDLRSSLHVLHLSQTPDGLPVVELTPDAERLDRDVILRFRVGEADILKYRAVEQKIVLQHHAEQTPVITQPNGTQIAAVDQNTAGVGLQAASLLLVRTACGSGRLS